MELKSPVIILSTAEGEEIHLHYFNSRVRTFEDSQFDHVELYEENRTRGLRIGREVIDMMFEMNFPMQYDPYVDPVTMEWYVQSEMRIAENQLEGGWLDEQ